MNKFQKQAKNFRDYSEKYAITLCDIQGKKVTELLPSQTYFITDCHHHPFAYSANDIEGGKISPTTVIRAIKANEPLCIVCREEKGLQSGRHLGAKLFQNIADTELNVLDIDTHSRNDITGNLQLKYICLKCGKLNYRCARDLASFRAKGCAQAGCSKSNRHNLKYCVQDVLEAARKVNLHVESISLIKGPLDSQRNKPISCTDLVVVSCKQKHHQYLHELQSSILISGKTGCPVCSRGLSLNEVSALTLIKLLYTGDDIKINSFPPFLAGLQMDILIESLQIGIEVQGSQHYKFFRGLNNNNTSFNGIKSRDEKKVLLCESSPIQLVVMDAREVEQSKSIPSKLSFSAKHLLPKLNKLQPDIFPSLLSKDMLEKAVTQFYGIRNQYINNLFLKHKAKFERFCERKGINILSPFVAKSVTIKVSCKHHAPSWRKPEDIMAAKGNRCCTGKKASKKRAIESAAKFGLIVDIIESEKDLKCTWPPVYVGKSTFWLSCLCGKVRRKANINDLESKKMPTCQCLPPEEFNMLVRHYNEKHDEYDFDHVWWQKHQDIADTLRQQNKMTSAIQKK